MYTILILFFILVKRFFKINLLHFGKIIVNDIFLEMNIFILKFD